MSTSAIAQNRKANVDLLRRHGYKFNVDRSCYVNREFRKVFSYKFVDERDEGEIERCVQSPTRQTGWSFFFDEPPTDSVRTILEDFFDHGRRAER